MTDDGFSINTAPRTAIRRFCLGVKLRDFPRIPVIPVSVHRRPAVLLDADLQLNSLSSRCLLQSANPHPLPRRVSSLSLVIYCAGDLDPPQIDSLD